MWGLAEQLDGKGRIVLASLSGGAVLLWYLHSRGKIRKCKSLSSLPGPVTYQPQGHLAELSSSSVHKQLTAWANEYGGMYKVRLMHMSIIVISDPVLVMSVLGRGKETFPKAKLAYDGSRDTFSDKGHNNLFSVLWDNDKEWHNVRKTLAPAFSMRAVSSQFPVIRSKGEQLSEAMMAVAEKPAGGPGGSKARVEIHEVVLRAAFDIVGQAGFLMPWQTLALLNTPAQQEAEAGGTELDKVGLHIMHAANEVLKELSRRASNPFRVPFQRLFPFLPSSRAVNAQLADAHASYYKVLELLKKQGPPRDDDQSIGACLRRLKDADAPDRPMSDEKIVGEIAAMLIGGHDTSATVIQWALYDIASSPEVQTKIRHELEQAGLLITADTKGVRDLQMDDLALPYFNLALKESMRLHNPGGSTATFREFPRDMEFGGYQVPKGTPVWVPFSSMANSVHNFEQPDRFWPERWLHEEDSKPGLGPEAAQANGIKPGMAHPQGMPTPAGNSSMPSKCSLPFSHGSRNCIGLNFGIIVSKTLLLSVLRKLWLEVDRERMGRHEDVEANQVMALTMQHKNGYHFLVSQHESSVK